MTMMLVINHLQHSVIGFRLVDPKTFSVRAIKILMITS